jgi:membrane protein YqaA with SNARE-associated domain
MTEPKLEGTLARLLRQAAHGRGFLVMCATLAFAGTLTATFPVTAVIVPAALLMPSRWRSITLVSAAGSAIGATVLVIVLHHLGWASIYERFPEMLSHPTWARIMDWAGQYGVIALFLIAISPLPQTPALIFFGVAQHAYASVAVAMFAGKLVKYGVVAWLASRFPERFAGSVTARWFSRP